MSNDESRKKPGAWNADFSRQRPGQFTLLPTEGGVPTARGHQPIRRSALLGYVISP